MRKIREIKDEKGLQDESSASRGGLIADANVTDRRTDASQCAPIYMSKDQEGYDAQRGQVVPVKPDDENKLAEAKDSIFSPDF